MVPSDSAINWMCWWLFRNRLSYPKTSHKVLNTHERFQELALHKMPKVERTAQKHPKKKQASDEPIHPNPENSFTHENRCLKKEIKEKKSLIEDMKEEAIERAWIHEVAISNSQKKDQIIARYRSKIKRCSRALEVMQKEWTSPDVTIEVIWDLIVDTISWCYSGKSVFLYKHLFLSMKMFLWDHICRNEFNI